MEPKSASPKPRPGLPCWPPPRPGFSCPGWVWRGKTRACVRPWFQIWLQPILRLIGSSPAGLGSAGLNQPPGQS